MDTALTFKRILLFLTAGLMVAVSVPAATLTVDNNNVGLTQSVQFQSVNVTSSDGSALTFGITSITYPGKPSGAPDWLKVFAGASCSTSPTSCPTPAILSLSLTNDLTGFTGPFHATITLTPSAGAAVVINVTYYQVLGGVPGSISVSPTTPTSVYTVQFTPSGITSTQVSVTGTSSYSVSAGTFSGGNWLIVTGGGVSGNQIPSTPSTQLFTISLNTSSVPTATALYTGTVVVTAADGVSTATINVNLSVNGGTSGLVTASPSQLTFAYALGAQPLAIPTQTIVVSTPAGATFTATTDSPQWIILSAQPGGNIPGTVPVFINPTGFTTTGLRTGKITISSSGASQDVAVQLTVTSTPVLWASIPGGGGTVLFSSQGSVSSPITQNVSLVASDGSLPTVSLQSYPSWLNASLFGNILNLTPNVSGTSPAVLSDVVVVASTSVANSPLSIPVVLVANGGGPTGPLVINPSSLIFTALAGGTAPIAQQLTVSSSTATSFAITTTNAPWLSVTAPFGTTTNTTLTVSANATGLAASATPYSGSIGLTAVGGTQTQIIPVTLNVNPTTGGNITTDTTSVSLTAQAGGARQTATVTVSNATSGTQPVVFTVSTPAAATWLRASPIQAATQSIVTITADPAGLVATTYQAQVTITPTGGSPIAVNVTFTVGSQPVITASRTSFTFTYLASGDIPDSQTVQISGGTFTAAVTTGSDWLAVTPVSGTTTTNLTISVKPSNQSIGSHAGIITVTGANNTVIINVSLNVSAPLPTVTSVLNGASFRPGAISGGEVISLIGTQLGPSAGVSAKFIAGGSLASALGGVQVLVNGFAAPLIYVSSTQVTAVVPYESALFPQAAITLVYLNQTSNVTTLGVTNTSPAIFTLNSSGTGPGARNADFSPNGPLNPAPKGGTVNFVMTGEGQLSPAGVTGRINAATGNPPAAALFIGVLIDNQPANWTYAGGMNGVVQGIIQLTVQIPQNVRSGDLPVLVTIGGNGSQSGVTVSVK